MAYPFEQESDGSAKGIQIHTLTWRGSATVATAVKILSVAKTPGEGAQEIGEMMSGD